MVGVLDHVRFFGVYFHFTRDVLDFLLSVRAHSHILFHHIVQHGGFDTNSGALASLLSFCVCCICKRNHGFQHVLWLNHWSYAASEFKLWLDYY